MQKADVYDAFFRTRVTGKEMQEIFRKPEKKKRPSPFRNRISFTNRSSKGNPFESATLTSIRRS